jgi:hypothetical protein
MHIKYNTFAKLQIQFPTFLKKIWILWKYPAKVQPTGGSLQIKANTSRANSFPAGRKSRKQDTLKNSTFFDNPPAIAQTACKAIKKRQVLPHTHKHNKKQSKQTAKTVGDGG